MFRKKERFPVPASTDLPPEADIPEESLEDVLKDLPGKEGEAAGSGTPDRDLDEFLASGEGEDIPDPDVNPGHRKRKRRPARESAPSGDTMGDEPVGRRTFKEAHPRLRRFINTVITMILLLVVLLMILSRVFASRYLEIPGEAVSQAVTPIQSFFAYITNAVTGYFRDLKLKSNIMTEYNVLRARNEELEYEAMRARELERQLSTFEDLAEEVSLNSQGHPLACTVIGRDEGNYFSTFTINKGTNDGVQPYMAVVLGGALIGYTEKVTPTTATVRTIIDSEASVAGIIESSRDQGTVRGTLGVGVDGQPMCRMYYLPDNHLPRPGDTVVTSGVGMSFPKGIPIGTVRESTRSMEGSKQYIVVEPKADFQHLEYVIVLRIQPDPEPVTSRENSSIELVPLSTIRPVPTFRDGASNYFISPSPDPNSTAAAETPTPTPSPSPSPTPSPRPSPGATTPRPTRTNETYIYVVPNSPSPTPSATPLPTPTPEILLEDDDLTYD